jgi:hypothetical protein
MRAVGSSWPTVVGSYSTKLDTLRGVIGLNNMDSIIEELRRFTQVLKEDQAEGVEWPLIQADRIKMRIDKPEGRSPVATFFVGYDS